MDTLAQFVGLYIFIFHKMYIYIVSFTISEKVLLTLEEAAAYTGIGINKLRILTDTDYTNCVLWNGSKRLLKREKLKEYLLKEFSI